MPSPHPSAYQVSGSLSGAAMSQTYALLFIALMLTVVGVIVGATLALPLIASGFIFLLFIVELALIWTAPSWSRSYPLNYFLFAAFPFFSGLTLTPIVFGVLTGYANGAAILLNALIATGLMTAAAAVVARMFSSDLGGVMGRFLFQSLIGLIVFGILQIIFPTLRGQGFEMIVSSVGIVVFSLFLAYDIQRLSRQSDIHSPFLLAISLYLDVYNLFLYILRFMLAFSGRRN